VGRTARSRSGRDSCTALAGTRHPRGAYTSSEEPDSHMRDARTRSQERAFELRRAGTKRGEAGHRKVAGNWTRSVRRKEAVGPYWQIRRAACSAERRRQKTGARGDLRGAARTSNSPTTMKVPCPALPPSTRWRAGPAGGVERAWGTREWGHGEGTVTGAAVGPGALEGRGAQLGAEGTKVRARGTPL